MRSFFTLLSLIFPVLAAGQTFTSSNLPIIVINTNNLPIPDDPKLPAQMGIIYNGPGMVNNLSDPHNDYSGNIGIERRGSTSQTFPKKSYGFETWDVMGEEMNASLLGLPAESDWILYASYSDKSLLNNVLACRLANEFGHYASRTRFVELVLNGEYNGVYVLMEKIKRDANRVDISKLEPADTLGDDVTGGYILKIDKFTGSSGSVGFESAHAPPANPNNQKIFFQHEYPSGLVIKTKQKQYIKSFVDSFEHALKNVSLYDTVWGWRRFADENSFVQYFLLNELAKNVDGYRISTFLYKKKITHGNKLFVGPAWDYDIAFGNASYCGGNMDTGWAYRFGNVCPTDNFQVPFWWQRLMQDTLFKNKLKCAYSNHRSNSLDTVKLFSWIDSTATELNAAQTRNFTKWPILGVQVWPNPVPVPASYAGEIEELKRWMRKRLAWLDNNLPGTCYPSLSVPVAPAQHSLTVYPNPFSKELSVEISSPSAGEGSIRLYSIDGKLMKAMLLKIYQGRRSYPVVSDEDGLAPGVYVLQVHVGNDVQTFRVIRQD